MTSPAPTRGRRPRVAKELLRDSAVEVALALAEREGTNALTMRRLGEELEVDPTTLYRLFGDKDEILLAVFDRTIAITLAEIGELDPDQDWRDTLRSIADRTWVVNERYPAIMSMTFARITGGPAERAMVEKILTTISRTGLGPAETVLLYRAFVDAMLSMCGQVAAVNSLGPEIREKDATAWARIYAKLEQHDYPAARRHAEHLSEVGEREIYDVVVESVIAMIERRAEADS